MIKKYETDCAVRFDSLKIKIRSVQIHRTIDMKKTWRPKRVLRHRLHHAKFANPTWQAETDVIHGKKRTDKPEFAMGPCRGRSGIYSVQNSFNI